ncbi:MAG TPA: hypothetical protein VEQ10_21340 [Vicinamibacteria bacterium]|nr:hypothetical protein [Vicinamibacteria bacterium]
MSSRTHVFPLGFGLSAVLCFSTTTTAADDPPPRPRPARVYTNEDLDRVHAVRDETGVSSVPAVAPGREAEPGARPSRSDATRGHGEAYWRRQAETTREKVRRLGEQAEELRLRIAREEDLRFRTSRSTHRSPSASGVSRDDRIATLQARLAAVERRAREAEEDLADRARKDGALPGWLR